MGKLQRQQLDINEFLQWLEESSNLYAKCSVSDKELRVTSKGAFVILHKGNVVYKCLQPFLAIEKYNEL